MGATNAIAASAAEVDQAQWHAALTPDLLYTVEPWNVGDTATLRLKIRLNGPSGLDRVDEVIVRIRDDRPDRQPHTAGTVTAEDIANTIWGPKRFNPNTDGVDRLGRQAVSSAPLELGEDFVLSLENSLVPWWVENPAYWPDAYGTHLERTVRLAVTCRREGYKPWYLVKEIEF